VTSGSEDEKREAERRRIEAARPFLVTCLVTGAVMQTLDATIANVALPYMQGGLSASAEQITWVLTSYLIAAAVMTAPVGWIAGRIGRKNFYIISLAGFAVASTLCGASQTLEQLVLWRIVQGLFGAAMSPLAQAMIIDLYPPEKRLHALGIYGTAIMLGPIAGPTLGGFLTDALNWRWVFYINVPFSLAAALGLFLFPSKGIRDSMAKFDWMGFAYLGIGIGSLQLMLDRGTTQGWFGSNEIIIEAIICGTSLYLFMVHILTAQKPLIPPSLWADVNFVAGIVGFFLIAMFTMASSAALPPYLQTLSGYSVLLTGIVLSPRGIGVMLTMQFVTHFASRIGYQTFLFVGVLLCAWTAWTMAHWTPDVSAATVAVVSTIQGVSMGLLFGPVNAMAFVTLKAELRTDAAAAMNLARNLGGGIGVALSTAVLAHSLQVSHASLMVHVTPFNRSLYEGYAGLMWNPAFPATAGTLHRLIERQAHIIAYSDDFLYLTCVASFMLVIMVLRKRGTGPAPKDVGHEPVEVA